MLPRLLSALIIGFWLCMTGILLRSIWFPADSRLTEVNPGAVYQLIAARGEPSTLDIYDDRRLMGHVIVSSNRPRRSDSDFPRTKLKLQGQFNLQKGLLPGTTITFNADLELNHGGNLDAYRFSLISNVPEFELTVRQISPESLSDFLLKQKKTVILDSTVPGSAPTTTNPLINLALAAMGISLSDLNTIKVEAEAKAAGMKVEARQGEFELGGGTRQGFILKLGVPGQAGYRLSVENTGEIVRLETPFSYHLLTETLRPESPPIR